MSISTCTISAVYVSTSDEQGLVHTFYRKEKVYNAETKTQELKGIPILVITNEVKEFTVNSNYLLVGNFHTSLHDTLVLYPYKVAEVSADTDINTVAFVGRLGKDPQTHYSDNGAMSVHTSFAHAEFLGGVNYNGKENGEKTVWTNVSFIPKGGENKRGEVFLDHVRKVAESGQPKPLVGISGSFHVETFIDKNTGAQRFSPKVLVNSIEFIASVYDGPRAARPKADLTSLKVDDAALKTISAIPF